MHITILTAGSRGDIQPYLALAVGLKRAGHFVKLATNINFKDWIESYGIEYAKLSGNPHEMSKNGEVSKWIDSGTKFAIYLREFKQLMLPFLTEMMHDSWEAAKGADLLIPSPLCYCPTYIASREQNIPWVQTFLQPLHPTVAFPSALIPTRRSYGKLGNLISHYMGVLLFWQVMRPAYNEVLENEFHLEPFPWRGFHTEIERAGIPSLYAYSPSFLSKPSDWNDRLHVTGYWFLDEGQSWAPPQHLIDFLDAGPAPVYVGFGSMAVNNPEKTTQIILDALHRAGQRGIILTGWGGLGLQNLPDNVLLIENVPHDWLFPRMAAIIHHGGAGTTAAALRSGKPSIVIPFFADQPWWGMRVYERGVSPRPIPRDNLTAENLSDAIKQAVSDVQIRMRAARLGEEIRAEDGTSCALAIIDQYLQRQ